MEKTGLILIIVQIVAKVFGFMREVVLSNTYGASNISDAYLIANSLPIEIFGIVSVGVTAGFIPLYNRVEIERGLMEADKFTANLMNLLFVFSLIICVLVIVFARPIVRLFALGFDQETLGLAVVFTQITILGIVFLSMNAVIGTLFKCQTSFCHSFDGRNTCQYRNCRRNSTFRANIHSNAGHRYTHRFFSTNRLVGAQSLSCWIHTPTDLAMVRFFCQIDDYALHPDDCRDVRQSS